MNMIKCTWQFQRKSNQHYPNHYFTIIIIHKSNQIKFWFLMRGENRSREPTNSIHIGHRVRISNPDHIGGRQVLSPPGQLCHQLWSLKSLCSTEFQKCLEMDKQKLMSGLNDKCTGRKKLRSVFLSSSCVTYLLCYLKILSYCGFNSSSIFYSSAVNCSVI